MSRLHELIELMGQVYPDWKCTLRPDDLKNPWAGWRCPNSITFSVIPSWDGGLEIAFVLNRELQPFPDGQKIRIVRDAEQALEELKVYLRDSKKGKRK